MRQPKEFTQRHKASRVKNALRGPDGRPKSRKDFQVLNFVSKTEIAFLACVIEKAADGTFSIASQCLSALIFIQANTK